DQPERRRALGAGHDQRRAFEMRVLLWPGPYGGFVTIPETLNAVDAWLSSIPGHAYANVRQPIVSTLNLAHLVPVSA
ncbi:hypothetical protein, partial [Paenibacillus larvae]|uniref:hypothetical protein n=1 Tax=Paenibacillus larvae TaxID=1464 RepID=UPI0039FD70E0